MNFRDKKIYVYIQEIKKNPFSSLRFKIIQDIRTIRSVELKKRKKKINPRRHIGRFESVFRAIFSARREENGCGPRIGREKAHFLGVKWSGGRVAKNDQRSDFPSALAAANGDPARPNARVDRGKGKHRICLAHFPSPLRSPLTLSAPAGSISLFLSQPDRFAFDTHGYVHVRVENGGCQFLFLRSKDSRRVVAIP